MSNSILKLAGASNDIFRHLATEDILLHEAQQGRSFLLFWQSADTVVIGKNQNPWRETWGPRLARESCALARRISGGGAVFHDEGNLNVSFILPRARYSRALIFRAFEQGLAELGVSSHFVGETNLGVDGRKVSGHAFAFRGQAVLHHATLLISTALDKMRRVLRPGNSAIQTHAVPSQPADVANLTEFVSDLVVHDAVSALERAIRDTFHTDIRDQESLPAEIVSEIDRRAVELASWKWVYGRTPPFEIHGQATIETENLSADLLIEDGWVTRGSAHLSGATPLQAALDGARFMPDELAARLQEAGWPISLANQIAARLVTM